MKLHTPPPPPPPIKITRLTIRKTSFNYESIMLERDTIENVMFFLKDIINNNISIDPFYNGPRISIDIRLYEGKIYGDSKTLSFKDSITPIELKELILKHLDK